MTSYSSDSLGQQPVKTIIEYLREIGDDDAADYLAFPAPGGQMYGLNWGDQVWGHSGMILGFIPPEEGDQPGMILNAAALPPDPKLKGARIKISLDRFYVHSYPGRGKHKILLEFSGKNQIPGDTEELRFAITTSAGDGSSAPVSGTPIFLGASVGNNGISFEGKAINVASEDDDVLLSALGSGPFKDGLSLLTMAQPALKPFVGLAQSVVTAVLGRSRNKPVYNFHLGLDFATSQTAAKLRYGSFVVVQGDEASWSWHDVRWNPGSQQIIRHYDNLPIEFNYMIFRVSPYEDDASEGADAATSPGAV